MRIGELLLERGWVDEAALTRALAEQAAAGQRVCSLLIARGQLDPDHAARALGEQHGTASVLQRHLDHRDPALVPLLPASLARGACALPIGRMRNGELIVCVRDPRPALHAQLAQAIGEPIVLAVAAAGLLQPLVDAAYERSPTGEFDVDMTTGPIVALDTLGELSQLRLVGLDDHRVARDPSQSGQLHQRTGLDATLPPPLGEPGPPARPTPIALPSVARAPSLHETLADLADASTRDAATDLAMRFAAGRWAAALLFAIKDGAALGHRGHGAQLSAAAVQAAVLPLAMASIVKSAHDSHRLVTQPPTGAVQDRLARLLGAPQTPAAAPVRVAGRVACVLVVGDPLDGDAAHAFDLEQLADALGDAYARILRDRPA